MNAQTKLYPMIDPSAFPKKSLSENYEVKGNNTVVLTNLYLVREKQKESLGS